MPATTQSCQNMTNAPRILAGASSAEKIGTVAFLAPLPMPMTNRIAKSCCQFLANPEAMGVAVMKISPRRPK